ncbi:MAG: tail fiber domain-containing protein [Verrucomicrobia bacterium]|nr:tail fiber domain-containing protein [Verrucomicrobiota bacterium]
MGDKISLYSEGLNSWGFGIQSSLLQIHTGNQNGDVAFGYGSSAAMTETMRVKGNGTSELISNPGAKLHVAGTMTVSSPVFGGPVGYGLVDFGGNERAQFAIPATAGQYSTDAAAGDTVIRATTGKLLLQTGAGASAIAITGGSVGIGTTSPGQAKLVVNGFGGVTGPANYYKAEYQVGIGDVTGAPRNIGIYANQSIWSGAALISSSDQRIKNVQGQSDRAADLQTLLGIEITDFRYKDAVAKGNAPQKKVIAQQVEKVFPQAVSKQTDVVPDIYRTAPIQNGWVTLTTSLKKGERVKLITEKNEESIHEVLEVTQDKFRTYFKTAGDKIFVYGREVNDFRTVD